MVGKEIIRLKKEALKRKNNFNVVDNIRELDSLKNNELPSFLDIAEDEEAVKKMFAQFKHGATVHSILLCPASDKCVHYGICPFKESENFKELRGKRCPFEYELFVDNVKKLSEQYGVESVDYVAYQYILEYAELEILDMRISSYINSGKHSGLIITEVKSVTEKGEPVFGDDISKAYELKEKIKNKKDKILKELVMTPYSKMKAKNMNKGADAEFGKYIETLKNIANKIVDFGESTSLNVNDVKDIIDVEVIEE